ncbi:MAG TPA: hypothetical protein PKN96_11225 [Flavobacterium sp.]|uniref:hypothetical protein n=1 Tax=Flavobacterium sp. TaxID=239 RepID=UPI002BD409C0|nr:hypothetical protein [Flavobacterium sp.]HNP33852.1 hypothetical protein [Flavobacterium sp.]
MKKFTSNSGQKSLLQKVVFFILFVGTSTISYSQDYRTIEAYMDDFAKNELYVKKSFMDYSQTIVESQLYSRTKYTAERIITKLENLNNILLKTNKGYEGNTLLRDSFIAMNQKTIDCLKNGTLILNDYDYQSTLSIPEIGENLNRKESQLVAYYEEVKNYENTKKMFAASYKMHFKSGKGKNILKYNAYQNILFYKMNVIDEKLSWVVTAKDKKGFSDCMDMIALMHQEILNKTNEYKFEFKDTSLNDANVTYADFIASQKDKLSDLFNDYVDEYNNLQALKNANLQTKEAIAAYNSAVNSYNAKKNSFYSVFNSLQSNKDKLYNDWLVTNSAFLKNNGKFDSIYEQYAFND